jgi:prophage antirepressor-like protein
MNDLTTFDFQNHAVRTVVIDSEPYWVARDVAEVLGYANTNDAISKHCRGVAKRYPIIDALGRTQEARVIGESDLYRLIAHSNLPAAEAFESWIYEEVLPTIRRTGSYDAGVKGPKRWGRTAMTTSQLASEFLAFKRVALAVGLTGNAAVISANGMTEREYGIAPLGLLGIELKSEDNERVLLPSEISRILGWKNAHEVNLKLAELGLQERLPGKKGGWRMTDKGAEYGVLIDTTKRHNNGAMVQQIKWKESVLLLLTEGFSA